MPKSNGQHRKKIDSAKLSLKINGITITPGMDLHSSQWAGLRESLAAKRLGMLEKRKMGALWRETMYRIDNPTLAAFDGKLEFSPRIHQFEPPPATHLSESLWRTSALVCFWEGRLFRWISQVSGDSQAAELFYQRAEAKVEAEFGPPKTSWKGLVWTPDDTEIMLNIGSVEAVLLLTHRPDKLGG